MPPELWGLGSAILGFAFAGVWIYAFVDVVRIPEWQFDAVESNKLFWLAVMALLPVVGALLWRVTTREWVLAAGDGRLHLDDMVPPAGWYSQPGGTPPRWWDGDKWTDRYDTWSGAPS
jgi:hypothetical protein